MQSQDEARGPRAKTDHARSARPESGDSQKATPEKGPPPIMETLRLVVLLIHLVGFALLFGGWAVEAISRRGHVTRVMSYGLLIAGLAGLALAAPWPAGIEFNYAKIGIKLLVLIVIGGVLGMASARQRRKGKPPAWAFWTVGALTLFNAAIAVIW